MVSIYHWISQSTHCNQVHEKPVHLLLRKIGAVSAASFFLLPLLFLFLLLLELLILSRVAAVMVNVCWEETNCNEICANLVLEVGRGGIMRLGNFWREATFWLRQFSYNLYQNPNVWGRAMAVQTSGF